MIDEFCVVLWESFRTFSAGYVLASVVLWIGKLLIRGWQHRDQPGRERTG